MSRSTTAQLLPTLYRYAHRRAQHGVVLGPPLIWLLVSLLLAASGRSPAIDNTATEPAFIGHWWGHARALDITADGRGQEGIDAGGLRVVAVHFRLLHVGGTRARAVATIRVTFVWTGKWGVDELERQPPYVGQIGTLVLREGVVTDEVTGKTFCAETVDKCGL